LDQEFRSVFINAGGDIEAFFFSVLGNIAVSEKLNSTRGSRQYKYRVLASKLLDTSPVDSRRSILYERALEKEKSIRFNELFNSSVFDKFLEKTELSRDTITPELRGALRELFFNTGYDKDLFIENASKNLKKLWFGEAFGVEEEPFRKNVFHTVVVPNAANEKTKDLYYKKTVPTRLNAKKRLEEEDEEELESYDPTKDESVSLDSVANEKIVERPLQAEFVNDIDGLFSDFCLNAAPENIRYDSKKKFQIFNSEIANVPDISGVSEFRSKKNRYKTGLINEQLLTTGN